MKIGISTIVDYYNYGNRLQNYALQQVLYGMGHEVETIRNYYQNKSSNPSNKIYRVSLEIKNGTFISKIKNRRRNKRRQQKFIEFTRQNISETEYLINANTKDEELKNIGNKFDAFIIGSDKVWNYTFPRFSEFDFVTYSNRPKISYAASFGVSNIEESLKDLYRHGLTKIDYISVRVEAGNKIVKDLIGVNPPVVLDPTMLLTVNEWKILTKNSALHIQQNYVVTYFLGDMTSEYLSYIKSYARKKI